MKKLYYNNQEIPSIEGIVNGTHQQGNQVYFHVKLDENKTTPEGVNNPARFTKNPVFLRNGERIILYERSTELDRLGEDILAFQIIGENGEVSFQYDIIYDEKDYKKYSWK